MNEINLIINTKALRELKLTLTEYAILEYILRKQADPSSSMAGWCIVTKKEIAETLNLTQRSVFDLLRKLLSKGQIDRHEQTKFIRVSSTFFNGTSFTQYEETSQSMQQEKESTKEKEYIYNTSPSEREGMPKKQPSCPLVSKKPLPLDSYLGKLILTYPKGHTECVEYLTSEEDDRGQKFINRAKQFMNIHKILQAGFHFGDMDKTIRQVEKKYGKGSWDYGTISNWLEKGSSK